jgi:hypothetical protein
MIETRGLTKRYGSTVAVNDLSFTVRPGVVTGFLGPNGAGNPVTELRRSFLQVPVACRQFPGGTDVVESEVGDLVGAARQVVDHGEFLGDADLVEHHVVDLGEHQRESTGGSVTDSRISGSLPAGARTCVGGTWRVACSLLFPGRGEEPAELLGDRAGLAPEV